MKRSRRKYYFQFEMTSFLYRVHVLIFLIISS
jgi:hypothetical protein